MRAGLGPPWHLLDQFGPAGPKWATRAILFTIQFYGQNMYLQSLQWVLKASWWLVTWVHIARESSYFGHVYEVVYHWDEVATWHGCLYENSIYTFLSLSVALQAPCKEKLMLLVCLHSYRKFIALLIIFHLKLYLLRLTNLLSDI